MHESNEERVRRAVMLFLCVHRRHKRVLDHLVTELGISNAQHRLLMHLYHTDCKPTQTELARTFDVSTAAITTSLKKLESEGLISRIPAAGDNRFNEITITEEGMRMVHRTHHLFFSTDFTMLSDLAPEELNTFIACLEKMKVSLKEMEEGKRELPKPCV